jgi:hypothetical protein
MSKINYCSTVCSNTSDSDIKKIQFDFSTLKTRVATRDQKCKQTPRVWTSLNCSNIQQSINYSTWSLRKDMRGVRVKMTHATHNE